MLRFGCQTYSWQMSLERYVGRLDHICNVVGRAGFSGLEAEMVMLGNIATADSLRHLLEGGGLELAALTLVEDWDGEHETEAERVSAQAAIDLTASFDGTLLVLCQMPGQDRQDLRERQKHLLSCVRDIASRAEEAGVKTTFHPNSPDGSIFRTSEDYEVLLTGLPSSVGFTPDLGHIARGGMDALTVVRQYRNRVNHLHAKDMDAAGNWALIGSGVVGVTEVVDFLRETGYEGWVVLEDESSLAKQDPDGVAERLGRYVKEVLRRQEESWMAGGQSQVSTGVRAHGVPGQK